MNVNILNPEHERFIDEQIQSGRFESAAEVVAEAIAEYIANDIDVEDFDDETVASLRRSFEQAERGETMTLDELAAYLGVEPPRKAGEAGAA